MDGTIIDGRVIFAIGKEWNFLTAVKKIMKSRMNNHKKTVEIARLLKGLNVDDVKKVIRGIPLMPGAKSTIKRLVKNGDIK